LSGSSEAQQMVTVSFHNMPASLIAEFAKKVAGPYFGGDLDKALASLMDKALIEEELFQNCRDKRRVIF
jgi:hypothetical protein